MTDSNQADQLAQLAVSLGLGVEVLEALASRYSARHNTAAPTATVKGGHVERSIIKGVYGPAIYKVRYGEKRYTIQIVMADGSKRSKTFKNEKAALAYKIAVLEGNEQIKLVSHTVGELLEEYYADLTREGVREITIKTKRYRMKLWYEGKFDKLINSLNTQYYERIYHKRVETTAADTHHTELKLLKAFMNWCEKKKYLKVNPAKAIEFIGKRKPGREKLRFGELKRLDQVLVERATAGEDGALACLVFVRLGFRISEVLNLRARDIDPVNGRVVVWIDNGKTDSARRWVTVPEPLGGLLSKRAEQVGVDGWLFGSPRTYLEKPRNQTWARYHLKRYSELAGVRYCCPHSFRGLFADVARENSAPAEKVAQALGQHDERVTKRHYYDPGTVQRAEVEAFDKFLN